MKKAILTFGVFAFVGVMMSCGGGGNTGGTTVKPVDNPPKAAKIELNIIQESKTPAPDWATSDETWSEGAEGGQKFVYLRVEAEDPQKETAKLLAQGQKIAQMADAIKQLATHEFAKVTEGMAGQGAGLETYVYDAVAAVSKNVDTSGALEAGTYWQYVQEIKGADDKTYYRYIVRYKIDYAKFMAAMKNAWGQQVKAINPELKEKGQKMLDAINSAQ